MSGSKLGYRELKGKNFSAPVVSWPPDDEIRYVTGDPTGEERDNARLVLSSCLRKTKKMPSMKNVELIIVRRIPRDPRTPTTASNPFAAQKNAFGQDVGFWGYRVTANRANCAWQDHASILGSAVMNGADC